MEKYLKSMNLRLMVQVQLVTDAHVRTTKYSAMGGNGRDQGQTNRPFYGWLGQHSIGARQKEKGRLCQFTPGLCEQAAKIISPVSHLTSEAVTAAAARITN